MGLKDKNHWEDHYALELNNFKEDGDEGEIWFGRRLNDSIANWVVDRCQTLLANSDEDATANDLGIIDIGCGNSQLLITLMKQIQLKITAKSGNFTLLGLDFSSSAVELSREILKAASMDNRIRVEPCDFLQPNQIESALRAVGEKKRFEFVLDKGTLDAICLLAEGQDSYGGVTKAIAQYKQSLTSLLQPNSVFLLASCNNTEDELLQIFQSPMANHSEDDNKATYCLRPIGKIDTPTISFGGKTGSQVACVMFEFVSLDS